jgi:hypothetical protein
MDHAQIRVPAQIGDVRYRCDLAGRDLDFVVGHFDQPQLLKIAGVAILAKPPLLP